MKLIILATAIAALLVLSGGGARRVEAADVGCQMEIWLFDSYDGCVAGDAPSARGKIYADGQCHTIETDASPNGTEYASFPGNYRVECTAVTAANLKFLESGCRDNQCTTAASTTGAICDRDDSTAASLFSRVQDPEPHVQNPFLATVGGLYICQQVEGSGHIVNFAIFGDCTAPGCSVNGEVLNNPVGAPTIAPVQAPSLDPTKSPVKAPTNVPATKSPTKAPTTDTPTTQSPETPPSKTPTTSPVKPPTSAPVATPAPVAVPVATFAPVRSESTGVPVKTPVPTASVPLSEPPVSEVPLAAVPSVRSQVTERPDLKPSSAGSTVQTTPSGKPVDLVTPRAGEIITVTEFPRNGSLNVQSNGVITYTPNGGFVGVDTFKISRCRAAAESPCTFETIVVEVLAANSAGNASSSMGLYALSILALVPAVIGVFVFRKRLSCGTKADQDERIKKSNAHSVGPTHLQAGTVIAEDMVDAASSRTSVVHGSVQNQAERDTAHAHAQTAARRLPPDPPVAQAVEQRQASSSDASNLPEFKDQCRADARESIRREPPLVSAILIDERHHVIQHKEPAKGSRSPIHDV